MNSSIKKSLTMLIVMSILVAPISIYSQDTAKAGTFTEGMMQGQMAGSGNAGWMLGGFLCGIFGVGGAYFVEPSPPIHLLMGKSTDYVMGFTEGYKKETKKKNVQYASIGCLGGVVFNLLMMGP